MADTADLPEQKGVDRPPRWVLGALAALQVAGVVGVFVWYRVKG